jgi:hypothetical protein
VVRAYEDKKRRQGGHAKKFLAPLQDLQAALLQTSLQPNDLKWKVVWYVAICTGNRIANIVGSRVSLTTTGLRSYPTTLKKTNGVAVSKKAREYLFAWTLSPPPAVREYIMRTVMTAV